MIETKNVNVLMANLIEHYLGSLILGKIGSNSNYMLDKLDFFSEKINQFMGYRVS